MEAVWTSATLVTENETAWSLKSYNHNLHFDLTENHISNAVFCFCNHNFVIIYYFQNLLATTDES
jgi:hypothetical protein